MKQLEKMIRRFDSFQQRNGWLSFPLAVIKKFGEDKLGGQAALISYYGFLSLFPLLLVFITLLNIFMQNDAGLRQQVSNSAFANFPLLGQDLSHNVRSLQGSGLALAASLIVSLYGSLGVSSAFQNAFHQAWRLEQINRPNMLADKLRGLGIMAFGGTGILLTTFISGYVGHSQNFFAQAGAGIVSLALNVGVFMGVFKIVSVSDEEKSSLRSGALAAAGFWQILQWAGGFIVGHQISRASTLYGTFAIVIGLLYWIYLEAYFTLMAVEINVVRARKLWPRSLATPPLTEQDKLAYEAYAKSEKRSENQEIDVGFDDK